MSAEEDDGPGRREVARRVFAAEYDDADLSYSESDEERAPNYVVVPTGARVNRLFLVGVLTELEAVNENVLRGRVVDPTGAFVVYAGQYQPEAVTALERADPPAFVSVTGKARTFQPEDSELVYASVRPESINQVDADTRDGWTVRAAEHTLARVAAFVEALDRPERGEDLRATLEDDGVDPALAAGIPRAVDHYGTTRTYLAAVRDLAVDAARVVAGERDEVAPLEVAPGEGDGADVDVAVPDRTGAVLAGESGSAPGTAAEPTGTVEDAPGSEADSDTGVVDTTAETGSGPVTGTDPAETTETETATETAVEGETATSAETTETETATSGTGAQTAATDDADGGVGADEPLADDEMYELDEEEREEIESEFGTEFASGEEIPEAGETDIETPDPEGVAADTDEESDATGAGIDAAEGGPAVEQTDTEADPQGSASPGSPTVESGVVDDAADSSGESVETGAEGTDTADGEEPPSGGDLEDAVVEEMRAIDEGDGADRDELVERVTAEYGVGESAVEDAIQDALMDGRCYESGDDALTPI